MVDAAYTDWGSTGGPLAEDPSNNMVCGAVTAIPWVHGGSDYGSDTNKLYDIKNCDNSSTPDQQLGTAIASFESGIASAQAACDGLGEDVCDAVNTAYRCLDGASSVVGDTALSSFGIEFPDNTTLETGTGVTAFVVDNSSAYLFTNEETAISSAELTSLGVEVFDLGSMFYNLANAYNSCAP